MMTVDEAEAKASTIWGGKNWKPVVDYMKAYPNRIARAQSDRIAEQELKAEEDLEKKPHMQSGSTTSQSSTGIKPIRVGGEMKKALFPKKSQSSIGTKSASDTRDNDINTVKEQAKLIVNLREHLADREKEIAQLKSAGHTQRKGSPEWRHEKIISQIDGLPTWTQKEAKKYYNSIGHIRYAVPTQTRKGMFWMAFTTDDNGDEVQTEKPIARWSPLREIIELERINQNKEMEIQTLLNTMTSNDDIMKVNELEGKIAHLKIKLAEAKESYVDINNIPFNTAIQVLSKGEFPELMPQEKIITESIDVSNLLTYVDMIQQVLLKLRGINPVYGDKKKPSQIVQRHNGKINDYGQLISADKHFVNLLEFCQLIDGSFDNVVQSLQGIEFAISKTIKDKVK